MISIYTVIFSFQHVFNESTVIVSTTTLEGELLKYCLAVFFVVFFVSVFMDKLMCRVLVELHL